MNAVVAAPVSGDDAQRASNTCLRIFDAGSSERATASLSGLPQSLGVNGHGDSRAAALLLGVDAGGAVVLTTGSAEYLDDLIDRAAQVRDELVYGRRVTPVRAEAA